MSHKQLIRVMPLMRMMRSFSSPLRCVSVSGHSVPANTGVRHYWSSRHWGEPFNEVTRAFERAFREFDRSFPFPRPWYSGPWRTVPVEVTRDGQRLYKIELELMDFKAEDVNVTVRDNTVTVRAKREFEADGCKQLKEYQYQYTLPKEADIEKIRSLLSPNGVLSIEAPLPPETESAAKEIPIKREK